MPVRKTFQVPGRIERNSKSGKFTLVLSKQKMQRLKDTIDVRIASSKAHGPLVSLAEVDRLIAADRARSDERQ